MADTSTKTTNPNAASAGSWSWLIPLIWGGISAYGAKDEAKRKNQPTYEFQAQERNPWMAGLLAPQMPMIAALAAQTYMNNMSKLFPGFTTPSTTQLPWGQSVPSDMNSLLYLGGVDPMTKMRAETAGKAQRG